ncbi:MAG: hypothetical protein IPL67_17935 [Ignavibacteria bacterium]|nr:hypothetical protein [Ignavibacteria bacterium]
MRVLFKMMSESLELSRELGDKRNIGYTPFNLAACADEQGDRTKSQELTKECQKIFSDIKDKRGVVLTFANLGVMEQGLGYYDVAIENY